MLGIVLFNGKRAINPAAVVHFYAAIYGSLAGQKVLSVHNLLSAGERSIPCLCSGKRLKRREIDPLNLGNGLKSPAKGKVFRQKLASLMTDTLMTDN